MRIIAVLMIAIVCFSCQNKHEKADFVKTQKQAASSIESNEFELEKTIEIQKDTLIKTSDPFVINNLTCFWRLTFLVEKGNINGKGILELINLKNNETLLHNSDDFNFEDSYYTHSFNTIHFESLNLDAMKDLTFDGFQDFMLFDKIASRSAGMFYRAYIFNPKTKKFELNETLSGYELTIDEKNKTLSTYAKNGMGWNVSQVRFFDKNGKVTSTEQTVRETISVDTSRYLITTFSKMKNDKIIQQTIDTTLFYEY